MLRKVKTLAASFLIAVTLYFGIATSKAQDSDDDEIDRPTDALSAQNVAYSAITAEANKRKYKRSYDVIRAQGLAQVRQRVEAERQKALKAERERLAVDEKAKQAELKRQQAQAKPQLASRSQPYVGRAQSFTATAYTAGCYGCSGVTATGHDLRKSLYSEGRRVIAVDPARIPLGSIVRITLGNGQSFEAIAEDTGGKIKGAIVDVSHGTKAEAAQFGRQSIQIQMIRKGR